MTVASLGEEVGDPLGALAEIPRRRGGLGGIELLLALAISPISFICFCWPFIRSMRSLTTPVAPS